MEFIIKMLGLDKKAQGFLVGYRTYILLAIPIFLNLGPVLIAVGNSMVIFAGTLGLAISFIDGSKTLFDVIGLVRADFVLIAATLKPAAGNISAISALFAGAYFKNAIDRHADAQAKRHDETISALASATVPCPEPDPGPKVEN